MPGRHEVIGDESPLMVTLRRNRLALERRARWWARQERKQAVNTWERAGLLHTDEPQKKDTP